jgi:hypothetical protein
VPKGSGHFWGPEADTNVNLLGDELRLFKLIDATHKLTEFGLEKTKIPLWRRREEYLALYPRQRVLVNMAGAVRPILRRLGFLPPVT